MSTISSELNLNLNGDEIADSLILLWDERWDSKSALCTDLATESESAQY